MWFYVLQGKVRHGVQRSRRNGVVDGSMELCVWNWVSPNRFLLSIMAEPRPSSRPPRQHRQSAISETHNNEEGEFSANQPANFVGAVHSIPVNPRLQMHSMFPYIYLFIIKRSCFF
jgi:hypothetical protein